MNDRTITDQHREIANLTLIKIGFKERTPRTPDFGTIEAWAEDLAYFGLVDLDDALDAVRAHYSDQARASRSMNPADLVKAMRDRRRDRNERMSDDERHARQAEIDARLAPAVAKAEERAAAIARFASGRVGKLPAGIEQAS